MGQQTAEVLQSAVADASKKSSGILASIIGIASIRCIWGNASSAQCDRENEAPQQRHVAAYPGPRHKLRLGWRIRFLLIVSLAVSAVLAAFSNYLDTVFCGTADSSSSELHSFISPSGNPICSYLQGIAGPTTPMA
jgi:hypothetical protein